MPVSLALPHLLLSASQPTENKTNPHPAPHSVAVGGGFFPASEFGGFTTPAQWDAAVTTWASPRMEVDHVKVWAWPPPGR